MPPTTVGSLLLAAAAVTNAAPTPCDGAHTVKVTESLTGMQHGLQNKLLDQAPTFSFASA